MDDWENGYLDGLIGNPVSGETDNYLMGHMAGGGDRDRLEEYGVCD